jgi:heme/copper-type cytochrome/quinol oxidase subunit 2
MVLVLRILALLTFLAAAGLIAFGWWGTFTEAGDAAYPEMQSYIPFFWGLVGVVMLGVACVLFAVAWLCKRMQRVQRVSSDAPPLKRAA